MLLTRSKKEKLVAEMSGQMEKSKAVVLVNYQGLKHKEIETLKERLAAEKISFQVVKNSLFKIALKKAGIELDNSLLDQPVAVIWGDVDEVNPAKLTVAFGKEAEKLEILGGILNGQYVDLNTVNQLAALPGRDELYAKLVGTLNAPMSRLVNALQGNLRSLVYILDTYKNSR
ncbi:TPA: 50S ribosomal protein L10 [Candidatus Berkelbacteria bacterium]|uniref:Large ribosomal subunit protein uL10 n=1 Tax=Berkelbacteria bacterium GW2011_GWE1_39_12 TaxID=1618337 RepID=A0A0G4B1M5_9BACT|nr:MAG: 50S ribosomal protein L10, large subunit ribosomal protein L10 [Berkelbacteria bacterium GW2011_GWE1_39_12]HBO60432.1 50S ribosomal protein L10 [Candidatus Berkelbacteria bacterium]